jgi:hypothetical protein
MKRLVVFMLVLSFGLGQTPAAFAAGPLEEGVKRAAQQLAQTTQTPSNKKTFLWSGAALTGAGIALITLANTSLKKEECVTGSSGIFDFTECIEETNNAAAWAGLGTAGLGAALMIVGVSKNIQIGPDRVTYRVAF